MVRKYFIALFQLLMFRGRIRIAGCAPFIIFPRRRQTKQSRL